MDRRAALPQLPPDEQLGDESNLPSLRQLFPEHLRMEAANAYYQQQQSQQSTARQGVYPPPAPLTPQQQHQLNIQQQLHGVQQLPPQYQTYQHYAAAPSAQPVQGSSQGVIHPPPTQGRELDSKYDCPYCGKRFDRPSSVKIHITSHTGEKPYVCAYPGCGRRFSVNSNMRRHLRTHAPHPQSSGGSQDVGEGDEDESTSPRSPPQSQPRPNRSAPAIPPIIQGQSRPPAAPTPPPPSTGYGHYTLHQQQIMSAQVPLRPHSQPLAPHGAVVPQPQPQHHATPGLQMPQYPGYSYAQYPAFSQSQQPETPESTRWLPSAGMPPGEQDYMPR